jgi:hypothetical protein
MTYYLPSCWKVARGLLAVCCVWGATAGVKATTIAHWDFENDLILGTPSDGANVPHTIAAGVHQDAVRDISGNGNHLSGYDATGGTGTYRSFVSPANNTGSTFSIQNSGSYPSLSSSGDLELADNRVGALAEWTIEASVNFTELGGFQTMVGLDGVGQATSGGDLNASNLYFQKTSGNVFSIRYVDSDGYRHVLNGNTTVAADTWYNVAASSDGDSLRLYVNGYLEASLDLASTGSTNRSLAALDESGREGNSGPLYGWSLMRGMYADTHGDRLRGYLDDVRISSAALDPIDFLNSFNDTIVLEVDTTTGQARLRNVGTGPVALDYYTIESPLDGALVTSDYDGTTGWLSLSDQQIDAVNGGTEPGQTWAEAQPSVLSAQLLVEQFLLGETTLGAGEYRLLGAPIDIELLETNDLEFYFAEPGRPLQQARVFYTSEAGTLPGDFNSDGVVDAADYTVWRDNLGSTSADGPVAGDADGNRLVNDADYRLWRLHFGLAAPAAALGATQVVPEAGSLLMLLSLCGTLVLGRRCAT